MPCEFIEMFPKLPIIPNPNKINESAKTVSAIAMEYNNYKPEIGALNLIIKFH